LKTYGTPENPFPELPPAASFYSVHWTGCAIFITRPATTAPLLLSTACPALLTSQGSWVSWHYATPTTFRQANYGVPDAGGGTFSFEINSDYTDAWWGDPGIVGEGDALYARVVYSSSDNELHWTIRTPDSWKEVFRSEHDPYDIVAISSIGKLPLDQWHCVMMSWVVGGASSIVYDDIVQAVGYEPTTFSGMWDGSYQNDAGATPPVPERLALLAGEGGHYDWWLSTEFVDFSVLANRRRFITAEKKPVALGTDGALGSPTNRKPEFFFHPAKTLADFTTNRGTSGAVQWTDQAGITDGYFVDPVWTQMSKPSAAGSGAP
jgi:hypothetical protein